MKQTSGKVIAMKKGVTYEMLAYCVLNDDREMMASFLNEYEDGVLVSGDGKEVWEGKNGQEN